jgi:phosphate transport system protein
VALSIFRDSIRAFAESDCALAQTLKPRDKELDALTTDIGEKLMAVASADPENLPSYLDLVFVGRALERVGDHSTNIAEDSFWRDQATDIRHTQLRSETAVL